MHANASSPRNHAPEVSRIPKEELDEAKLCRNDLSRMQGNPVSTAPRLEWRQSITRAKLGLLKSDHLKHRPLIACTFSKSIRPTIRELANIRLTRVLKLIPTLFTHNLIPLPLPSLPASNTESEMECISPHTHKRTLSRTSALKSIAT